MTDKLIYGLFITTIITQIVVIYHLSYLSYISYQLGYNYSSIYGKECQIVRLLETIIELAEETDSEIENEENEIIQ